MKNKQFPDIRFPGFLEDWQQLRFEDFISKAGKKNLEGKEYPAYSVSNKFGLVSQSEHFENSRLDDLDKKSYKIVNPDEFVYNPARINVGSIAFNNLEKIVIVSSLYVVIKISQKLDNKFILQFINSQPFINEVKRNTEGSVREYLFFDSFKNIKFPYTPYKNEQSKIGDLFNRFDSVISLRQQELASLKQTKQGFLQKMFPKEGESVPEVRFPGFNENWEQRKLGDITNYIKGFAFKSKDYKKTGVRIIRVSDLSKDDIKNTNDNKYIDFNDSHLYGKYMINYDDIIITTVGSKAEMKEPSVGRPIIITSKEKRLLNQNLVKITPTKEYISYFIYCQLLQPKYINYLALIERGNANQANIAIKDLWKFVLQVPSKEEQEKIGRFLEQLDETIALHQQELDLLKETKKAFLQKMFI